MSLDAAMDRFAPALPLLVAFSGGADSTALLVACARRWPGQIMALHVNHGLQAAAPLFEAQCHRVCGQLQVPLFVAHVQAQAGKGESPEDIARRARYQAFDNLACVDTALAAIKSIAFAHNADDQVETVILALSRGAGLGGLSAMPEHWSRGGRSCHRPLLRVSAADIRAWLSGQGMAWVEDPTNADVRFTRNRIRHTVLPALREAFPHVLDAVARSARHVAQAQGLLEELAQQDLFQLAGAEALPDGLPIRALQALSVHRQANVLRYWLRARYGVIPATAQLEQLLHQITACKTRGHRIDIRVGYGFARRAGLLLVWSESPAVTP